MEKELTDLVEFCERLEETEDFVPNKKSEPAAKKAKTQADSKPAAKKQGKKNGD